MTKGNLIVLTGDQLEPENVEWLWPGWLARGKFIILAGNAGTGKSTVMLDLCAKLTRGQQWPDGTATQAGPEGCLVWDGEDDIADTLVPRFLAAGGDPARMGFVQGLKISEGVQYFDPANDDHFNQLLDFISRNRPALVGISPLAQMVVSKTNDMNAGIRRDLNRLVNLANKMNCAIIGIHHLSKGTQGRDPLERLSGSLAFGALARGAWINVMDETHNDRRMVRVKVTNGIEGGGIDYVVEPHRFTFKGNPIDTSRIRWGTAVAGSPGALIHEMEDRGKTDKREAKSKGEKAFNDACELLMAGPMPASAVKEELLKRGHKLYTIEHIRGEGILKGKIWDLEADLRRKMSWTIDGLKGIS